MKTDSTRQRILDATQRLIERDGSIRLTTKEIAREAGCAEGTLFNHFKSKEDLSLAVVLENAPKFRELLSKPPRNITASGPGPEFRQGVGICVDSERSLRRQP